MPRNIHLAGGGEKWKEESSDFAEKERRGEEDTRTLDPSVALGSLSC